MVRILATGLALVRPVVDNIRLGCGNPDMLQIPVRRTEHQVSVVVALDVGMRGATFFSSPNAMSPMFCEPA